MNLYKDWPKGIPDAEGGAETCITTIVGALQNKNSMEIVNPWLNPDILIDQKISKKSLGLPFSCQTTFYTWDQGTTVMDQRVLRGRLPDQRNTWRIEYPSGTTNFFTAIYGMLFRRIRLDKEHILLISSDSYAKYEARNPTGYWKISGLCMNEIAPIICTITKQERVIFATPWSDGRMTFSQDFNTGPQVLQITSNNPIHGFVYSREGKLAEIHPRCFTTDARWVDSQMEYLVRENIESDNPDRSIIVEHEPRHPNSVGGTQWV